MRYALRTILMIGAACGSIWAQTVLGDSARGAQVLRERGCTGCHRVDGEGGRSAPELGKRMARLYTPASLAGVVWNHAPSMWAPGGSLRDMDEREAADLFAYFSSQRYFERPGDAARGKRVFTSKHCAGCHGISNPVAPDVNPVAAWSGSGDAIALAQAMWNRPQLMHGAFDRNGVRCPVLTSQELTDLAVFLEKAAVRGKQPRFHLASPGTGRRLFLDKGCVKCHQGKSAWESHTSWLTMTDITAAVWNHPPATSEVHPSLSYEETSSIIGYLWAVRSQGDPHRGKRLFAKKQCADCHGNSATGAGVHELSLTNEVITPVSIMAALWTHGPTMQAELVKKGRIWPHFADAEMADLGAYLTSR
jgi:mono/diheme cytochrome c family protein